MVIRGSLLLAGIVSALSVLLVLAASVTGAIWLRGDEIAFVSYHDVNPEIVLLDVNHDLTRSLTPDGSYNVAPAWSPDGQWIAFASDREGKRSIYVMDALGGNLRRVSDTKEFYSLPRWSADGKRVLYTALNENPTPVYSVNLDGSDVQRTVPTLAHHVGETIDPASNVRDVSHTRSPDGSRIAFLTYRDQGWAIYIGRDQASRDVHLLVKVGIFTEAPTWSPDGSQVAYIGLGDGRADLYVVDVDGSPTPRRLTFSQVIDASPVWRP